MIQKIIPYTIALQIFVGLFHMGMGIEEWRNVGVYDSQTLFLFMLGMGTYVVYLRLKALPVINRSFKIIFEHAVLIGMIAWLFYHPWGEGWELFLILFMTINSSIVLIFMILESQFHINFGGGNWGIPEFFWKLGSVLTLLNTITIPLIFILLHESMMSVWFFYGINWVFLWKEDFSQKEVSM